MCLRCVLDQMRSNRPLHAQNARQHMCMCKQMWEFKHYTMRTVTKQLANQSVNRQCNTSLIELSWNAYDETGKRSWHSSCRPTKEYRDAVAELLMGCWANHGQCCDHGTSTATAKSDRHIHYASAAWRHCQCFPSHCHLARTHRYCQTEQWLCIFLTLATLLESIWYIARNTTDVNKQHPVWFCLSAG